MDRSIYLLRLEIQGIKNIEKPIEIDFYKKTINRNFNPEDYKVKAIYGENGSGKTAVITAVKILKKLILERNYVSDGSNQKILVECVNKKTKCGSIECEFISNIDDINIIIRYRISFEVREDYRFYISGEVLEYKPGNYSKNQFSKVYEVTNGILTYLCEDDLLDVIREKTANLLEQRALATWAFQRKTFDVDVFKDSRFFDSLRYIVFFALTLKVSMDDADDHSMYYWKERIPALDNSHLSVKGRVLLNRMDDEALTVKDEKLILKSLMEDYEAAVSKMCSFIQIFKPELSNIEIESKDVGDFYKCNLIMIYDDYSLDSEFESRGIKKLINLYSYLSAATDGYIVFIDELDSNINDVYLDKIIEHFVYYGKGQLCFTAHNLSPMNVLRKCRNAISFISSINTVHTWAKNGNQSPENAYKNGFVEDSPFNVDAADFLGIIGGGDE